YLAALVADVDLGLRHDGRRSIEFASDAVDDALMDAAILGIASVFIVARATREERAHGGMCARKRAIGDRIAIDIEIAAPGFALHALEGFELLGREHLAAALLARVVPGEGIGYPVVHADVEIGHDHDRRLQKLREIEGIRAHRKDFGG